MAKTVNLNMTEGPLLGKIIRFSVPLMLSGMLQLLYNAADVIVVGRFAGSAALAAVGSTGALVNLLINLFMGVSVGCNVLVARYYGAGDLKSVSETGLSAIGSSLIIGVMASVVGLVFSTPLLRLAGCRLVTLHTLHGSIPLPGLTAAQAEALRQGLCGGAG